VEPDHLSLGHGLLLVLEDVQGRVRQLQRQGGQWCQSTCGGCEALGHRQAPDFSLGG
jgi:hypothetical protein